MSSSPSQSVSCNKEQVNLNLKYTLMMVNTNQILVSYTYSITPRMFHPIHQVLSALADSTCRTECEK